MNELNVSRGSGGGAATQGGVNYQNRVGAWVCVHILAEKSAAPVGPQSVAAYARFETSQPVDDLLVGSVDARHAFLQAKRNLTLSTAEGSEFASVIDQFVRQFLSSRGISSSRPWDRILDPAKDLLVLVTTSESSLPLRRDLAAILNRIRGLTASQPLTDAATNVAETEAMDKIMAHIRRCWNAATGENPSDEDVRTLLALMHVNELDVEAGEVSEREAISLLESQVLADRAQSRLAWSTLLHLVADLSHRRSGTDQAGLRRVLEEAGIQLRSAPRYERDIARLKDQARETLRYLAHNSEIPAGGTRIRVRRHAVEELKSASDLGSIVVVGWPGAGKSGVLHDFAESSINEGRDIVFIAVDQVGAKSLGELRNELGIDYELVEVLLNWPGQRRGLLVIDALDAARGDPAVEAFVALVHTIVAARTRWHVVTSIRKYDLRYNHDLQQIFRGDVGTAPGLRDPEFANVRHLNVPLFTDEEMADVRRQSPPLDSLLRIAPHALTNLLRVPFNLRLAADILETGVDPSDLTPIRTQSELLRRYWVHRVAGTRGDLRERIIRKVCELMIQARRLRVERRRLVEPGEAGALGELLSNHVLVEWQPAGASAPQRQLIAFTHHILFDYAASQLFLPPETDDLVRLIAADPDLVLMIRPSIVMRFQHLWESDRDGFWRLLFLMCADALVPNIAKVIGAAVAAESGRLLSDFEPLERALQDVTNPWHATAGTVFRFLVGALTSGSSTAFAGSAAGPYCELIHVFTRAPSESTAGYAQTLLREILQDFSLLTRTQFSDAGQAARNILAFAWRQERRSSWLVVNALRSVCSTFSTDVAASASLLRRSIEPQHLAAHGYEEAQWLVRDLKAISGHDPKFVADVYVAIFGHEESSTERTDISGSRILSLTSHRRQDYEHAKWQLAQDYPDFFQRSPLDATRAVLGLVDSYVRNEHRHSLSDPIVETFDLNGKKASVITDYSHIWDHGSREDHEIQILSVFFRGLEELVAQPTSAATVERIITMLLANTKFAAIWARLLRLGAAHPAEIGLKCRSLAWAVPILTAMDTEHDAGDFVSAIFPLLSSEEREKVERAILSLVAIAEEPRKNTAEKHRARLLGRLNLADLVTPETKQLLEQLSAAKAIPAPTPRRTGFHVSAVAVDERTMIEDVMGVSTEPDAHKKFLDVHGPVQEFQARYVNGAPTLEEANAVLPKLEALRASVHAASAVDSEVDPKLIVMGSGTLAAACKAIAHLEELPAASPLGQFVQPVLLEMSHHPAPEHDPARDASFDEHPSWGAPIARIEAAAGLILLARHASYCTPEVLEAIERLGRDTAPEVRYQITTNLTCLYNTAQDQMWKFLDDRIEKETSNAVLDSMAYSLNRLAGPHADRSAALSKRIFDRLKPGKLSERPRDTCLRTFVGLHVWRDHKDAERAVYELTKNVQEEFRALQVVLTTLRGTLTHGVSESAGTEDSQVRLRSVKLFDAVTIAACDAFNELVARSQVPGWSEANAEVLRNVAHLVDGAATELYFASGVFTGGQGGGQSVTFEQQVRFYKELAPTIDRLSTIGLASMVHRLVEMLEVVAPIDPPRVFLQVAALIEGGKRDNYQYESMAVDNIVRIVRRYLAEYRSLLQEDVDCRAALRKILDAFVAAGWPAAQRLSYRLDEIYR